MGGRLQGRAVAFGLTLVALILLATPRATHAAAPVLGGQLFSTGAPVTIKVLPADAGLTSTLYLLEPEEIRIATNRDVGTTVTVGPYASGEELIFGIRVSGNTFKMGPGSRNPDGVIHATVQFGADGCAIVGFEDLFGGGDRDYNDNVFQFCGGIAPEPPPPPPPPPPPATDVPPTANAGPDQSVPEGSVVTLDGSASHASGLLAHTYSTTADFADGRSVNLSSSTADELRLADTSKPSDFVWIAASARGTILKIDARTGKVLGEYASAPQNRAKDPANATVDENGNAWVGNRAEASPVGGVAKGSVAEIGLAENGQCVDRNGNGKIDTSSGLGDVKPWPNASGADDDGGVSTAADECIVNYVRTDGVGISQLSVDSANDVWAGGPNSAGTPRVLDRISQSGTIVRSIDMTLTRCCGGGLVDPGGTLWSSTGDANQLVRIDPSKPNGDADLVKSTSLGRFSSALGIDPAGFLWQSNGTSNSVQKVSPTGTVGGTFTTGGSNARGVAVTPDGNVWVANFGSNSVSRLRSDGTLVTQVGVGQAPTGVAVDGAGKVWSANQSASTASRVDPATNAVDLTVNLGSGAGPDDASDMTGSTLSGVPDEGTWSVVFDSQAVGTVWSYVDWDATVPGDAGLSVSVAPSVDGATFGPEVRVGAHAAISGVAPSRYLRITVHFTRSSGGASPELLGLSVAHSGGEASALAYKWRIAEQHGPPIFLSSTTSAHPSFVAPDDGTYTFELTVTDASGESDADKVTVVVHNVAPSLVVRSTHGVTGSLTLVSASHTDPGWLDTHTGTIDWGDGTTSALHVTDGSGWGTAFGSHRYTVAGSYHIALTLTDDDGGTATATTATADISAGVAVWANSSTVSSTIDWSGGTQTINGRVHSNRDVKISSSHNRVNGSFEYVNSLTNSGSDNAFAPAPARSTVQPYPVTFTLADYQPGGRAAIAAGTQYYDMTSQCRAKGKVSWTVSGTQLATGLYYAPCDVTLTASSLVGTFTIVSTGSVSVSGSQQSFAQPFIDGLLLFSSSTSTSAITISGSNSGFSGFIDAPVGRLSLSSSNNKYYCGLLGDRIVLSGSNNTITGGGCAQPQDDTSATLLVPTIGLDLNADRTEALPSQKISYGLSVSNRGSSLIVSGLVGAENVDSVSRSVAGFRWALETFDVASKTWQPLATVTPSSSQGASLSVLANAAPGVTYGSPPFVGAALAPGSFASWSYEATAPLDPAAVRKLLDPTVTGGIRVRFDLDFGDPAARVRQLFRFGNDFIAPLRAQSGDITDTKVTLLLPTGDPVPAGPADFPGLGRLAPGDSVSLGRTYTVAVPAARSADETDAGYLERLLVLDRSGLVGSSFALGHGGVGQLVAPLVTATTTERLPVVGISTIGPDSIVAGATDSYDLHLSNLGSTDASAIGVSADAAGSPLTVTGAPTTLVPGGLATAKTTYTAPATSPPPDVTVTGSATWSDAAGNTYGPARSAADTRILTPGTLAAGLSDSLVEDVDHDGNVSPGDTVRYTLVARNLGGAPLQNATATITPDPNSSLVVGSVTAAGGTVATGNTAGDASVHVTWASIAGNSSRQATFDVRVASPFPSSTTHLQVQGRASADGVDPVLTDDPALPGAADPTRTPVVVPAPNLTAFLSGGLAVDADGSGGASAGDTLRYSLVVSSVGALPVTGIGVTVPVPAGTSLVPGSVTTSAGTVRATGIGIDVGTLAMLDVATIGFDLKIDNPLAVGIAQIPAQGTVSSNELPDFLTDDPNTIVTGDATVIALHGAGSGGGGSAPPGPSVGSVTLSEGAVLTVPTTVTATLSPATGTTVTGWTVSYRRSGDTVLTELASGTGAGASASRRSSGAMSTQLAAAADTDVSATIDPTVLPNGAYELVIRTTSSDGGVTVSETSFVVDGTTKPGRYQTTYEDLNVPVGTIPLQVLRTYDSFDKSNGDFGVGWRLELANFHVTTNGPLGRGGWRMFGCGPGLIFVPLCFDSSKQHYVTVTWPDGHVETFDLTPAKGSTFLAGLTSAQFSARPGSATGTTSKLEALDSSLYYSNGDLLGGFFGSDGLYDPKQFRLTDHFGTSYILDVDKGLLSATDRNGNTVTVTRDGVFSSLGPSIAFTRDTQGRIKRITDPEGKTIEYTYDAAGDLVQVTDQSNRVANYTYTGNHDLATTSLGGGPPLRTLHYGPDGRLASVTDGSGNTTEIDVDPNTRQQTTTGPDPRLTTLTSYDDRGNPVRIERIFEGQHLVSRFTYNDLALPLTLTDPLGHTTTAEYDDMGDLTKLVDRDGVATTFTYNAFGGPVDYRVDGVLKQHLTYDSAGDLTQVDFAPGLYKQFGYDPQGRLTSTRDLAGRTQSITYDANGFPATVSGPRGTTRLTYDSLGRLRADVDPLGGITQFGIDDSGLLTSVTDPLHHTWAYTYDPTGRLQSERDPTGKTKSYTYDDAGRLHSVFDRNGVVTTFGYGPAGRVASRVSSDGTSTQYDYDPLGRLTSAENENATVSYTWDPASHPLTESLVGALGSGLPSVTITRGWTDGGRLASLSDPNGATTYGYDAQGRLDSVSDTSAGAFALDYDVLDRLTDLDRQNGADTHWTYTGDRIESQLTRLGTAGPVLDSLAVEYDGRGFPTSTTDLTGTSTFTHDALGRLTSETHPAAAGVPDESYAYDAAGNRTSWTGNPASAVAYDANDRLLHDARWDYTYDDEGRLVARTDRSTGAATHFGWDAADHLLHVTRPNGAADVTYRYDPFGRRVETKDGSTVGRTVWAGDNPLLALDGSNGLASRFVHGLGPDAILASVAGGTSTYPIGDASGTVRAVTTSGGAVSATYRYDAFGNPAAGVTPSAPHAFGGFARDPLGMYNARARTYDPTTGRFLSEDPLPAVNLYLYAEDSPLLLNDPYGESALVEYGELEEGDAAEEAAVLRGTNTAGEVTSRGSFRLQTVRNAWEDAAEGPTGGRLCPTCGDEVNVSPGSGPRDWDVSHNPSWTNREFPPDVTRQEVLDNYQEGTSLECPACNRSGGANDARFDLWGPP